MISHGDEFGRTQHGNNNAYCQDNELSWIDWDLEPTSAELLDFTRRLIALRRDHPVFRRRRFLRGDTARRRAPRRRGVARGPTRPQMAEATGSRDDAHAVGVFLNGDAIAEPDPRGGRIVDDSFLILFNGHWEPVEFRLPDARHGERGPVAVDTGARRRPRRERGQGGRGGDPGGPEPAGALAAPARPAVRRAALSAAGARSP